VTVDEVNLRVQIATLRKAFGQEERARYISNVAGRGYCFVAPVTRSQEPTAKAEGTADREQSRRLPPRLARMVGRDDTIRAVSEQLLTGRFVSIVGPGGIGKTTVAVSVAHALLAGFSGAVSFVDLSALTKPQFIPTAVASALGILIQANDPFGSIVGFLGDKKILLVLDNCEHVIDSAAIFAERLVSEAPQAHVLTTSREALRVEGERVHLLYSLSCPPDNASLTAAEALKYSAAQLFMERATAAGYSAALIDIDAPVVATICRRLDGIALAIELAASRAGSLGIRGIAEQLDNRLSLLWQGRRTALPRHQTLNAMLDWSYNLLPEHERAVLSKLSVFVGDFTIEAACSVASEKETDQTSSIVSLESLITKSLISTRSARGPTYYRLLDTTGAYARKKLIERGDADRAAQRHANFFSRFLQHDEIVQSRFGERDLSGYASHVGNVRAALEWAFSDRGDVAVGIELATWAAPLFIGLSLLEECKRWCEQALACLDDTLRGTRQEMILQEALALSSMFTQGDANQVRAAIERGLTLEETFGDRRHKLQLLYGLYRLLMRLGDFRGALKAAQQAATFAESAQEPAGGVVADFMLGTCYHFMGDQAAAQLYGERGMALAVKPGTVIPKFFGFDHRIYAPISLARTLWLRGFADQARRLAKDAVDGALDRNNPLSTCVALTYGSAVFIWSGDLRITGDYVELLVEYAGRHSIEPYRAVGLGLKGVLAIARGDVASGVDLLRGAVGTLSAKKQNNQLTPFAGALAESLLMIGRVEEALLTVNGAIARAAGCGSTFDMPELLRIKAEILAATPQHSWASVVDCLNEAIEAARVQSALALELRSTMALARLLSEGGQPDEARRALALVYGHFTEGFETKDLKLARALLQHLQP
jgi:predicted ATPase